MALNWPQQVAAHHSASIFTGGAGSMMKTERHPQGGFTLIELIIVIILLGITSTFVFNYLGFGAQVFRDTTEREQLVSQSRFALERLSRELSNSLPRSVRETGSEGGGEITCLEFVPIRASSSYLQIPRPGPESDNDLVGIYPVFDRDPATFTPYLFIGGENQTQIYGSNSNRRKELADFPLSADSDGLVVLDNAADFMSDPVFPGSSVGSRYYVTSQPVSWCYNQSSGELRRYRDYGFVNPQPLPPGGDHELMARLLVNDLAAGQAPFTANPAILTRNNLVQLELRFQRQNTSEPLILQHEVHVPNVP